MISGDIGQEVLEGQVRTWGRRVRDLLSGGQHSLVGSSVMWRMTAGLSAWSALHDDDAVCRCSSRMLLRRVPASVRAQRYSTMAP